MVPVTTDNVLHASDSSPVEQVRDASDVSDEHKDIASQSPATEVTAQNGQSSASAHDIVTSSSPIDRDIHGSGRENIGDESAATVVVREQGNMVVVESSLL